MIYFEDTEKYDVQKFHWGEVAWVHEPSDSTCNRLSVGLVKIFAGKHQAKHFHLSEEQLFYVVKGHGIHMIDDNKSEIKETMIIYCPPYSQHEVINTGTEDLIIVIVYVPSKLGKIKYLPLTAGHGEILDIIDKDVLESLAEQMSVTLKLNVLVCNSYGREIVNISKPNSFCEICKRYNQCNSKKYANDNMNVNSDKIYICNYGVVQIETPIMLNDIVLGYIKCGYIVLDKDEQTENKIAEMSKANGLNLQNVNEAYDELPHIIKSSLYAIGESMVSAAEFVQEIAERQLYEHELSIKNNEIMKNTKDKLKLENALKEANNKLLKEKPVAFFGLDFKKEKYYPYNMEIELEEAILSLDADKVENIINTNKLMYTDCKNIVREMITVLLRTALRQLKNTDIIAEMRQKYDRKFLIPRKEEDLWEILNKFCMECIDEHKKTYQANSRDIIENVNVFIQKHYKENINLNVVAEAFYLSPNYISSLFNERNKISLTDYINSLRIQQAQIYLIETNMRMSDISRSVGFKSNSYFIHVFKKLSKTTPKEYRKSNSKI